MATHYGSAFFAAIGLVVLAVTASQAACSKPDTPGCALERVPFAGVAGFDECRNAMIGFRDAMEVYASCLEETSADQAKAARDAYEEIRVRFNQRAREDFDQKP